MRESKYDTQFFRGFFPPKPEGEEKEVHHHMVFNPTENQQLLNYKQFCENSALNSPLSTENPNKVRIYNPEENAIQHRRDVKQHRLIAINHRRLQ